MTDKLSLKQVQVIALSILLLTGAWSCDLDGKYKNEKVQLERLTKYLETFNEELDKSSKRINAGRAIIEFIRDYKSIKEDIDKIVQTYPGLLTSAGVTNAPKELKPYFDKVTDSLKLMKAILEGKKARFGGTKDFLSLIDELKEVMYYY